MVPTHHLDRRQTLVCLGLWVVVVVLLLIVVSFAACGRDNSLWLKATSCERLQSGYLLWKAATVTIKSRSEVLYATNIHRHQNPGAWVAWCK